MTLLSIHPVWFFLLSVAGMTFSLLLVLFVALNIASKQEDKSWKSTRPTSKHSSPVKTQTPDIMGKAHKIERQTMPNSAMESQNKTPAEKTTTFAKEIPEEELDEIFGEDPDPEEDEVDLQEEESELQAFHTDSDNEFATGTTFEELGRASRLIRKEKLNPTEQQTVVDMAVKLSRTDLWDKITEAILHANEKIAKMLDSSTVQVNPPNDWRSFDIRNFI